MYENYELFFVWIISFILSFIVYMMIMFKFYDKKLKKIKDMSKTLQDDMLERISNIEREVSTIKVDVGNIKTSIKIWGLIISIIFSTLITYGFINGKNNKDEYTRKKINSELIQKGRK